MNPMKGLQPYDQVINRTLIIETDSTFHFSINYRGGWGRQSGTFNAGRWKLDKDTLLLQFNWTNLREKLTIKYVIKNDQLSLVKSADLPSIYIIDDFRFVRVNKWHRTRLNEPGCFSIGVNTGCKLEVLVKKYNVKTIKNNHF